MLGVSRQVLKHSRSAEISRFVNPFVVDRIIKRDLDLMRNQVETPEEGCRAAGAEINAAILGEARFGGRCRQTRHQGGHQGY